MKTLFLLLRELSIGIREFLLKHSIVSLYFIILMLSYSIAFILICVGWYVYELISLGYLNQNNEDTFIALIWSLVLMLPIADLFLKKSNKK